MNFLRATLATAGAFLFAAPAQALTHDQGTALFQQLNRIGVTVNVGINNCPTNYLGYYHPGTATMTLCVHHHGYTHDTLVHESWHVVQDCLDGQVGDGKLLSMGEALNQMAATQTDKSLTRVWANHMAQGITEQELAHVKRAYPSRQVALEWEATVMEKSPDAVINALRDLCL